MIRASSFVGLFAGATSTEYPRVQARGFSLPLARILMWVATACIVAVTTYIILSSLRTAEAPAPVVVAAVAPAPKYPTTPVIAEPSAADVAAFLESLEPPPVPEAPAPVLKPGQEVYAGYIGRWINVVATGYSPHDPIDGNYHATKGKWRWITADGETNVLEEPYGIAVPHTRGKPRWRYGTKMIVPVESGYLSTRTNRVFTVDDTGSTISRNTRKTGVAHIDLRFRTTGWAQKYGTKNIRVFLVESENTGE